MLQCNVSEEITGTRWCLCSNLFFDAILRVPDVEKFSTQVRFCDSISRQNSASMRVDECGAPIVAIPGGEPLLHPQIEEIIAGIVARKEVSLRVHECDQA